MAAERMKLEASAKVGLQLSEELDRLKAELAEALRGNRYAQLERIAVQRAEKAETDNAAKDARIAELEADNKRLREALDMSEAAISEFYRYWTGGEMRGSYDGKPERDGLWKAMYKARAALGEGKR